MKYDGEDGIAPRVTTVARRAEASPALFVLGPVSLLAGLVGACAGQAPAERAEQPGLAGGVRQTPLTVGEVERRLAFLSGSFAGCYHRLRLTFGVDPPSSYVVRVEVPSNGGSTTATVLEATVEGQQDLERCIVDEVEGLRFPPHVGEPLVLDVPIRAPKR